MTNPTRTTHPPHESPDEIRARERERCLAIVESQRAFGALDDATAGRLASRISDPDFDPRAEDFTDDRATP